MVPLRTGAGLVHSVLLGAAGSIALVVGAGCSSSSSSPSTDGGVDAPRGLRPSAECPLASQVAACTAAPASACTDPALGCAPDALPTGLACAAAAAGAQCSMAIDPCPDSPRYAGSERIDAYVCTCTSGHWRCVDCYEGASLCVESPDGSLYFERGADGGADARPDAEAGPDVDAGADAYADADGDAAPQADATVDASSSD